MKTDGLENLFKRIEGYRNEMIEMQKALIPIKAIAPASGGKGELKKAKFLEPHLNKIFDTVEWINSPQPEAEGGIRPNLVCKLNGNNPDKTIWFMAHMDVVPAGDESLWETKPFEAVVKNGRIYGRGAEDNNQGLVSSFFAIKAIKESGITPEHNVGLLLVADEEPGSNYGIKYILDKHFDIFSPSDEFIVPDRASPDGDEIAISEKGVLRLDVTAVGKQTHAAYPYRGINANRAISNFIVQLDLLKKEFDKEDPLFDPPICTMEATRRLTNVENDNTIPGKEFQVFDCRILPCYSLDEVFKKIITLGRKIEKDFGVKILIEKVVNNKPAPTTPINAPVLIALKRAIKDVYHIDARPKGIGGATVARFLRNKGFKVAVWFKGDNTLHGPNEYCVIDNMTGDAKVFSKIMLLN